jgi:tRNA (guanosine-2'-O-)-methyltransferase
MDIMTIERKKEIFERFSEYITPERKAKIERNAHERTRYVTVVLEDIFQPHNTSAVLRSCECFGIQDIHIIEQKHKFVLHESIAKGSAQWLDIKRYGQPGAHNNGLCFDSLKRQGYAIVATTPHTHDMVISQLPLTSKIALVFGTEQEGLSSYALEQADFFVKIPMYGFTESFNISVSVGICLYDVCQRLRSSTLSWRLSEDEIINLQLDWLGKSTLLYEQICAAITNNHMV